MKKYVSVESVCELLSKIHCLAKRTEGVENVKLMNDLLHKDLIKLVEELPEADVVERKEFESVKADSEYYKKQYLYNSSSIPWDLPPIGGFHDDDGGIYDDLPPIGGFHD